MLKIRRLIGSGSISFSLPIRIKSDQFYTPNQFESNPPQNHQPENSRLHAQKAQKIPGQLMYYSSNCKKKNS